MAYNFVGHYPFYKTTPGENCPIHQIITKPYECYGGVNGGYMVNSGALNYFNDNSYHGAEGEQSHMSRAFGGDSRQSSLNPNINSQIKIHDTNRPAGCWWLNGIKGYQYFNYIIDPTLTNPKNFIDRGGVCKAPGNKRHVMSNLGYHLIMSMLPTSTYYIYISCTFLMI